MFNDDERKALDWWNSVEKERPGNIAYWNAQFVYYKVRVLVNILRQLEGALIDAKEQHLHYESLYLMERDKVWAVDKEIDQAKAVIETARIHRKCSCDLCPKLSQWDSSHNIDSKKDLDKNT